MLRNFLRSRCLAIAALALLVSAPIASAQTSNALANFQNLVNTNITTNRQNKISAATLNQTLNALVPIFLTIASQDNAGNLILNPGALPLTPFLDRWVGGTQGTLVCRGNVFWQALPSGALGTVLTSAGQSACPTWLPLSTAQALSAYPGSTGTPTICWVDGKQYSTLAAALAVCSANADIYVGVNQTVSAPINVTGNNVAVHCLTNATFTHAPNTTWTVTGSNFNIDHCSFAGPGKATTSNAPLFVFSKDGVSFHDNRISGWGAVLSSNSGVAIVTWAAGNHAQVYNNAFNGNGDMSLSIQSGNTTVSDFAIYGNTFEDLLIYPSDTASAQNIRVYGNNLVAGSWAGQQGICLWIANVINSSFTGNTCVLAGNIQADVGGAYSFAKMSHVTVSANTISKSIFDYVDTSFEFNGCVGCTISGNYGESTNGGGMICESCNSTTFTGNVQNGWGGSKQGFWFVETGLAYSAMNNLNISGNLAVYTYGYGNGNGILLQGGSSRTAGNITISGNNIVGPAAAGGTSYGVNVNGGAGSIIGLGLGPDYIRGVTFGYAVGGSVSGICRLPGPVTAANAAYSGPTSSCN